MAKQSIRSIRKGSVQWNEEDRLQMVSMLAKAGYAVQIVRKEVPGGEYGFTYVEHKPCYCPRCNHVLNAGPNFQPKYCSECGQKIDFSEVKWEEEKILEHAGRRLANE